MMMDQLVESVRSFDGVLVLAPDAASGAPEIAWGDFFFYYAPDGQVPRNQQPYGTIVTKDYPDDVASALDGEGRWRVNVHVGRITFHELLGVGPKEATVDPGAYDFSVTDVLLPHPVYGALGWIAVVDPGERTGETVLGLLRDAHAAARARAVRRAGTHDEPDPADPPRDRA